MKHKTYVYKVFLCAFSLVSNPLYLSSNPTKPLPPKRYTQLRTQIQKLSPKQEKKIAVVIASYNNKKWYQKNLDSLFSQTYNNYHAYYIDDHSPDGTGKLVENYIKNHKNKDRITLTKNKKRVGALANIYNTIMARDDQTIIVSLDGDDWFANPNVLSLINKIYSTYDVWMTYGQYKFHPNKRRGNCQNIPSHIITQNKFRKYRWLSSHLRTFYTKLFKKIKKEDFFYNENFYSVAWDMAFMFPMLEMSGKHSYYIDDILYIYNFDNPINDEKIRQKEQLKLERHIRNLPPYIPLKKLF